MDDFRQPKEAFVYGNSVQKAYNFIYLNPDWVVVKSYDEFTKYISENGLPSLISFDHDLADEHYAVPIINSFVDYSRYAEKTGLDCAKWLCEHIMDNNISYFPAYLVHSMNDAGCLNIVSYIESFKKIVLNEDD